jgi:nitroreductase
MDLYDVMRTTFAARSFEPDPIPEDVLRRILDHARFAPSGGNRQGWGVISIRDSAVRKRLQELMTPVFRRYVAQSTAGENPWNTYEATRLTQAQIDATPLPPGFLDSIANAPTLLLVLSDLRSIASIDSELDRIGIISGASIYPFAWNILLAARSEGYGGTLTTFVTHEEEALRELFDFPESVAACALLPLGKPVKQLTKLSRKPVDEFAWLDRWQGEPLG